MLTPKAMFLQKRGNGASFKRQIHFISNEMFSPNLVANYITYDLSHSQMTWAHVQTLAVEIRFV